MHKTIGAITLAAALLLTGCDRPTGPAPTRTPAPAPTVTKEPCAPDVTVAKGQEVTCDLEMGDTLTVTGLTKEECDKAGGKFIPTTPTRCRGVDF